MQPEELMTAYEDKKEVNSGTEIMDSAYVGIVKDTLDNGVEKAGFAATKAEDHSFSMVSYKQGPSGDYCLHKPNLILFNRNIRHFLKKHSLQSCWHHVKAILEVSLSASHGSMIAQILKKILLMFKAQPFH
jgi:hypothetical protein